MLKVYKISDKKYRGFMSYEKKTDLLFQKWQEFGEFWPEHLKSQNFYIDWLLLSKVYNVWPKKYRCFMTQTFDAKFEEKLTCGLENNIKNLASFHQSTEKSQN